MCIVNRIRIKAALWYVATLSALVGIVAVAIGVVPEGWVLVGVGGGVLVASALATAWRVTRQRAARPIGGLATIVFGTVAVLVSIVVAVGLLPAEVPFSVTVVTLAAGAQAFLLAIDVRLSGASRAERVAVPFTGHLAVLAASALMLEPGLHEPRAAYLAYATGFGALSLHAFWMYQRSEGISPPLPGTTRSSWEGILLAALTAGVLATAVVVLTLGPDPFVAMPWALLPASVVVGVAAILTLAVLSTAPDPPVAYGLFSGEVTTAIQHALVAIVLLNTLVMSGVVVDQTAFSVVLAVYLGLLVIGVGQEYWMVAHARRRLRRREREEPPEPTVDPFGPEPTVTVIISAANEAGVLPESLDHNLESLPDVPVLLLPAANSTDGTVELAHEYAADYPERVRVIEGTSGSKAGDLNAAWDHVDTPFALLLDADETVDSDFLTRAMVYLEEHPEVGVVQGRKVAKYPDTGRLARFVTAERQHSTWVEHPFLADVFGAGHFAGSAAVFRREVPPAVGGWSTSRLTEDIDLTLRLLTRTDWRVGYDPWMVAREFNPDSAGALIRQRVRWARGWAQVTAAHLPRVIRSWRTLGVRRVVGLTWLLFTAVSAPFYTVFPVLFVLAAVGWGVSLPALLAVGLAVVLFPARGISIGYATLRDPEIHLPRTPRRVGGMLFNAYLWIPVGWVIQLHSLYLQLAGAPTRWHVTKKQGQQEYVRKSRRSPASSTPVASESARADTVQETQPADALQAANGSAGDPETVPEPAVADRERSGVPAARDRNAAFEVYRDAADEWRFRLRAGNGEIVADSGEGYASRSNARRAVSRVRKHAELAALLRPDPAGFVIHREEGRWRWRLVSSNGRILAENPEGYAARASAVESAKRSREGIDADTVSVVEANDGSYRWQARAKNGTPLVRSVRRFETPAAALDAAERVSARIVEADLVVAANATFEVYADAGGEWRWRLRHQNGNILADSGEGYASRSNARRAAERLRTMAPNASVQVLA